MDKKDIWLLILDLVLWGEPVMFPQLPVLIPSIVYIIAFVLAFYLISEVVFEKLLKIEIKRWKLILIYIVPIIIISLFVGFLIPKFIPQDATWTSAEKLEEIYNKNFENETVVIDKHRYIGCNFKNVTFAWYGDNFQIDYPSIVLNSKVSIRNFKFAGVTNLIIQIVNAEMLNEGDKIGYKISNDK
jgi:uncharacterized membrane protein YraQ (UPF0718 family)